MQNAIRAKQRCSRRAELHEAVGRAPDSDGQIPSSGNSTKRICDPGMSSQIPRIGEYQSMARRKLRPPVPNVAPIVLEGNHSPTLPNGSYDLFSFSPPHQMSHVSSIPLSIVYEPKLADRSPHTTHISHINSRRSNHNHSIQHHKLSWYDLPSFFSHLFPPLSVPHPISITFQLHLTLSACLLLPLLQLQVVLVHLCYIST